MSEFFLKNVGLIVAVGFGILLGGIGIVIVGVWLVGLYENIIAKAEYRGSQKLGQKLITESYWFSEDPPTMNLIKRFGESAVTGHGYYISESRDKWREERSSVLEPKTDEAVE